MTTGDQARVEVFIGAEPTRVGSLVYSRQGRREYSALAYAEEWLANPEGFAVSGDLPLRPGHHLQRAATPSDSVFHGALADTEPDAWGRRVITRDHAKRRARDRSLMELTNLDYLLAVDDFSRVGALRLRIGAGGFARSTADGRRRTPPLLELPRILDASRLLEEGRETAEDLRFLLGKGTSLGGVRPKCTVLDEDGRLAIGKFPSVGDTRSVTRGEVLALELARLAGLGAARGRVALVDGSPVALIRRFDRTAGDGRLPYQSAASLLGARRGEDRAYSEIGDAIRSHGASPTRDLREMWRRIVFRALITDVDDHLQNHAFLYAGAGLWRLAPAFDLNPFPDKRYESKTWLTEADGPVTDLGAVVARCEAFALDRDQAISELGGLCAAIGRWREVALAPPVGLAAAELDSFAPAFEHERLTEARRLLP
ncbi:MAG: HipA domain-containing protein [Bifidobacteriaceae bacterium]|nr:HipA domain-containing protein [Bifidobacteriaceae bacterium]